MPRASGASSAHPRTAVLTGLPAFAGNDGRSDASLLLEKPVCRPRQAEILAQRLALVVAPEDAAALQLRHHAVDEVVEPAGQIGEHHGEAVAAVPTMARPE